MARGPLDQQLKNLSRSKVYTQVAVVCDTKQKKLDDVLTWITETQLAPKGKTQQFLLLV